MQVIQAKYARDAAALLVLSAILSAAPLTARSEDTIAAPAVARRIVLPMLRVGGIPQGQVLQITDRGSEMVAAPRMTLASAGTAASATQGAPAPREAKTSNGLFCAGSI